MTFKIKIKIYTTNDEPAYDQLARLLQLHCLLPSTHTVALRSSLMMARLSPVCHGPSRTYAEGRGAAAVPRASTSVNAVRS